jgi:hypothetical protein
MRKLSVLVGTAVVSAVLLVAIVTTATFAQGTGPGNMGLGMKGGQGRIQGAAPITPTQPLSPAAPGVFAHGQGGQDGYGPEMMLPGYGRGGLGGMVQRFGESGRNVIRGFGFGRGDSGMMDDQSFGRFGATGQRLTAAQVRQGVATYLAGYYNNPDLEVVELMEFEQNFYALVAEKSTEINACELLIDPYTGAVQPEYGPNRMWNTKYGQTSDMGGMMPGSMMDGLAAVQPTAIMPVTAEQAPRLAQQYLDAQKAGLTVEKGLDVFYGYYTVHSLDKAGNTVGMLSVNGYTGQVWYHIWHGKFIGMADGM